MQPGAILAWTNCNSGGGTQYHPYYCGENSDDIPKGCSSPGIAIPPSNKLLYCCQ